MLARTSNDFPNKVCKWFGHNWGEPSVVGGLHTQFCSRCPAKKSVMKPNG